MSLRSRILFGLAAIVLLYGSAVVAVQQLILQPGFDDLERSTTSRNLARAVHAIDKDVQTLEHFCHDWAAWDDTYHFLEDGNEEFVRENLILETFSNGNFDLAWLVTSDGRVMFGEARDPAQDYATVDVAEFPAGRMPLDNPLLASRDAARPVSGLLRSSRGPMIVSSWPVTDSLQQSAPDGWIIMGRFLDEVHIAALIDQTRVPFIVEDIDAPEGAPDREARAQLAAGAVEVQTPVNAHVIHAWSVLPDMLGRPALLLRIEWPREITRRGADVLSFALVSLLTAATLTLVFVALMLQRMVIRPISDLTAHALRVGHSDDLSSRVGSTRRDELGTLAREFDSMVSKLETSRAELVETARLAGRSEVARAVLHNVGNVLNSVNVSAVELRRGVGDGALADLARLDAMLAGHEDDLSRWIAEDPRGRHLPAFLVELARHGREQHAALMAEAGHLADGLEHVSALVRAQADNVSAAEPAERVDVARQLDCALKLSDDGQPVEVRRDYAAVPELLLPRHRLLEVLVNLLRNARQSLRDAPVEARQLVVRVARHADHVRVEGVDNGLGIAKEHLLRIFQQHFTTKRDGHGIGLHAAANAARELGGTLQAYSDGPGTGATFVLELPVAGPAGGSVA